MMPETTTTSTAMRRVRWTYYLSNSLIWFATVLPLAITVLYAQSRGFSLTEIGLYGGLYSIATAAFELPSGLLADRFGRKRITLWSLLLAITAVGTFLISFTLPVLLVYAVLLGASRALGSGALLAWFVDEQQALDPNVDLQPSLAVANTVQLLALALATLSGGLIPTFFHDVFPEAGQVLTPLAMPLIASMLMHAVALLAVWRLIRESRSTAEHHASLRVVTTEALTLLRGSPVLRTILIAAALAGVALMAVETFWQPFMAERLERGTKQTWLFGVIMAGSFGAGMAGSLLSIPLSRMLKGRYAAVAALFQLVWLLAILLLAWQTAPGPSTAFLWLAYLALGGTGSPLTTLFNQHVPSSRRSVMLSVDSLATFAGAAVGSLALGWLAENTSISVAWTVAATAVALSSALLLRLDRRPAPDDAVVARTQPPHCAPDRP